MRAYRPISTAVLFAAVAIARAVAVEPGPIAAPAPAAAAAPLPVPAAASPRPRIGLVLSGGGARGAAHIGVLKVLDELHVPIDAIAGTSMGAVVGGLYASGLRPAEIESIMGSVDWQEAFRDRPPRSDLNFRRKSEDQNFLVRLPVGLKGGDFRLPKGLIGGQKLGQVLHRYTLPVAGVQRFDDLPTPFRAVATDLETGERVVLADGDLAGAMRASLSAPGVFVPVERDGRLLVDGGLTENLPVAVAREMGVDVLIVVDVGFPLRKGRALDSVATISNQMLAILIRRESDAQRRSLGPQDLVIDPQLGDASSFDFGVIPRAIVLGEQAARERGAQLAPLALDPRGWAQYQARRDAARLGVSAIDYLRVAEGGQRYRRSLQALFGPLQGTAPDAHELERRTSALYGSGNLETLDWSFEQRDGRDGLVLAARRNSWGPNYVRFGLNLQDDFEGNSSFNAAARFVLSELDARGSEWVWDFQLGESPHVATEAFLPLDYASHWFLMPHARFDVTNVPLLQDGRTLAEFRLRSFLYGIDVGRQFGNWGEIRAGLRRSLGRYRVRLGDPALPRDDFDEREYFARLSYDELDDVNFPRRGQSFTLEWRGQRVGLGSDAKSDLLRADWLVARSRGRNTGVFWTSAGTLTGDGPADPRLQFPLGGFLNLSGLTPGSIAGPHFAIARLLYYRQVGRGGEGFLNVPAYVGLSYEAGNTWQQRREVSFGSLRQHGSVFIGLDTLLGPVYLGSGFGDSGETAYYLFLGRTF